MVVMAKFLRSLKTTFKQNLTCIFYLSELIQKTQFAMTDPVHNDAVHTAALHTVSTRQNVT